ncbi:helix-turn-helix transcriptional regulator [Nocardia fluminea]|uniref:helix-turn-helix domain-containing protein n=1 Tax=Nocardia fluminea TaxID=134984 RepID=UPI0037F58FBC
MTLEPSTATERLDLFARAHAPSARESQVLSLLATGLDSRELATELFLSEHTINDHVKAVLAKSDTRTRQRLLTPTDDRSASRAWAFGPLVRGPGARRIRFGS